MQHTCTCSDYLEHTQFGCKITIINFSTDNIYGKHTTCWWSSNVNEHSSFYKSDAAIYHTYLAHSKSLTTVSAFNVKELFHSYVCPKSSLSHHKSFTPNQLEGNLVSQNWWISMSNVSKWTTVDKDRSALYRENTSTCNNGFTELQSVFLCKSFSQKDNDSTLGWQIIVNSNYVTTVLSLQATSKSNIFNCDHYK